MKIFATACLLWMGALGLLTTERAIAAPRPASRPALAGLQLGVGVCPGRGDSTAVLDCRHPDSLLVLTGTFQVADTIHDFVGMGITIDFETETGDLPPFWRFEPPNGCNRSALSVSDAMMSCGQVVNLWGENGSASLSAVAGYGPEYQGYHRGRLVAAVVLPSTAGVDLVPGHTYYGFSLRLFSDNATEAGGKCSGCSIPLRVVWTSATLSSIGPDRKALPDRLLTGPGERSNCVRLNGAKERCVTTLEVKPRSDAAGAGAPADSAKVRGH